MEILTHDLYAEKSAKADYIAWQVENDQIVESSLLYIPNRHTPWVICLPSSVGCKMSCSICSMPFRENVLGLSTGVLFKIVEYSLKIAKHPKDFQISFMGQGEPLLNTQSVFSFLNKFNQSYPNILIGISTVGIADGIHKLQSLKFRKQIKLQLSVHMLPAKKRQVYFPSEKKHPIMKAIFQADKFAQLTGSRYCINYTLLEDINDSIIDAKNLIRHIDKELCYVKISKYNEYPNLPYRASNTTSLNKFVDVLRENNISVKVFESIGTEIKVGCGQTRLYKNCLMIA